MTATVTSPAENHRDQHGEVDLYEVRRKIYPRAVSGLFAKWRWSMVWITQLVFYGLPWLTWNNRPAVLLDIVERRFYLFGAVLYPQDFIYLTGLLFVCALALFLFTAVAGRLWCGYACPQTVYTEIFMWIERKVEGDRAKRMKLDAAPMSVKKFATKATKIGLWLALAIWTGLTFVGYFSSIRGVLRELLSFDLGPWETFWICFYSFATFGNAGFMREQVCKYMCPYARFQSAMFDKDTMIITYDRARGEPRGSRSRKADPKTLGLGDCIGCGLCVEVCPTGIDIRNGLQYECIGCAACVDACDTVMGKMGYPKGLVRYDTENGLANRWTREQLFRRVLRPRVLIYLTLLAAVTIGVLSHLILRTPLKVDVIRDRGTLGREVENGQIENVYRLQLINSAETARKFRISVQGIDTIRIASNNEVLVDSAGTRMFPIRIRVDEGKGQPGSSKVTIRVEAIDDPRVAVDEASTFYVPR